MAEEITNREHNGVGAVDLSRRPFRLVIAFVVLCVLLSSLACGYMYYYANYIPADKLSASMQEKRESDWHTLSGGAGLFDVRLAFLRHLSTPSKVNRNCFTASVTILRPDTLNSPTIQNLDWNTVDPVPAIDSIVVTCKETGLRAAMRQAAGDAQQRHSFHTDALCLARKHKEITIEFVATMLDTAHQPLATDTFAIDLVRWEDRNWLGLE